MELASRSRPRTRLMPVSSDGGGRIAVSVAPPALERGAAGGEHRYLQREQGERKCRVRPCFAATALEQGLTVVTRSTRHLEPMDVKVTRPPNPGPAY